MMTKEELISHVVDAAYVVHRELPPGFLESVYKKALAYELRTRGITCSLEQPINVMYKDFVAGEFFADILVDGWLILELKAVSNLCAAHEVQLVNYLNATHSPTGLLINFGSDVIEIRRKYSNRYK